MSIFKKAQKTNSKLRMAIAGPSGSGKTYTALAIGTAIDNRVALLDTEHGSAAKYADLFDFDTVAMSPPYDPDRFVKVIEAAAEEGYDVLIIDSLSHAWSGQGGLLEIVDNIAARQKSGNSFSAWKDATPKHNRLIEAMIAAEMHLIATMRSKQEYVMERDDKGRTRVSKKGMAPIQRDGMEYEFDLFAEMDMDNKMLVQKSRIPALSGAVIEKPGKDVASQLVEWLHGEPVKDNAPPPAATTEQVDVEQYVDEAQDHEADSAEDEAEAKAQDEELEALWATLYETLDGADDVLTTEQCKAAIDKGERRGSDVPAMRLYVKDVQKRIQQLREDKDEVAA